MSTIKKDSLWIFKPHRTVLINNKTTKQDYLFFYYIYGLLCLSEGVGNERGDGKCKVEGVERNSEKWGRLLEDSKTILENSKPSRRF